MNDIITYLLLYELKKLKTILQGQLEDVKINLILNKDKTNKQRFSNINYLKMFISTKVIEDVFSKTSRYYKKCSRDSTIL
ncbi:MAG: hypothetical protein HFJ20_00650 [Clostridia bacterium]|nr:hypothetical protein [Clostridia bacterium]